jgi:hypothetical protein
MDELMKVKDLNGLSHKVVRLPQRLSDQPGQGLLGVLANDVQQGQRFGQFTRQASIEFPDGCAFLECFTQVAVQAGYEISYDFIGGCHSLLQ